MSMFLPGSQVGRCNFCGNPYEYCIKNDTLPLEENVQKYLKTNINENIKFKTSE
jgi:hypothetical protein